MKTRRKTILGLALLALASTLSPEPAAAAPDWVWAQTPTPGNAAVRSLAVAPSNIPFVQTADGKVWFLQPAINLQNPEKWVHLSGITSQSLYADLDGTIWALDSAGVAYQPNGVADPNFRPVAGKGWKAARGWAGGCARAMAASGVGPDLTEAFMTPPSNSWDRYDWVIGCDARRDATLWVIQRRMDSGGSFWSSGWRRIASGQEATSAKVAVFTSYGVVGAVQDVWFQDSIASGGLTWRYDAGRDRVVNIPNPPTRDSSKPTPPLSIGTAITDHYARFKSSSPNSNRGWLYRWNDDTEAWDYVIGDPSSSVYIDQIASSEAYASQIGWIGSSNVWATDNSGRLYYLLDRVVPK